MPTVTVFTRHSKDCPRSDERFYRRCDCPKWHEYMLNRRQIRKTAKTRSWERANSDARNLEKRLESAERGEVVEQPKSRITVTDAVERYLGYKQTQGIGPSAYRKQGDVMRKLSDFCKAHNLIFLDEVKADHLSTWRNGWKLRVYEDGALAFSWKIYWAIGGALFRHAQKFEWILSNEAAKLSGFKIKRRQVQPFSPKQMTAILAATDKCGWTPEQANRVKTFILLMRWSGLSVQDAVCLPRAALDKQNRIHTRRKKTGTDVFTPLPEFVATPLRALLNSNPDYFFWDGTRGRESMSAGIQLFLRQVFAAAEVAGTSHMFRHTFSVELLKAGVPIEEVSKLLGHESVSTTEKHYSAWVKARQTRLENVVKESWERQGISV